MHPWRLLTDFSHDYKKATQETFRIDHTTLMRVPLVKFSVLTEWETKMQLRSTRHLFEERLKPYLGTWSRNRQYIELYKDEFEEILTTDFKQKILERRCILVELGFNSANEVCKAAYVYPLQSRRFLFLCIGMDYGIKTAYVTPFYKFRPSYHGMRYLGVDEAIKI